VTEGDAPYALPFVGRICREVGLGVPGTPQERKRAEIIRRELERYLSPENVVVEEFAFAPAACLSAFPVSAAAIFGLFFTHGAKNVGILPGAVQNLSASAVAVALCRMLVASPTLISSHMGGDRE
jgi:hypothetical protein